MTENAISRELSFPELFRFALPSIVMMVFMSLYTIVDGLFVSRFVGSDALSAVNIAWPLISLINAIGIMFASGGSAIVARQMGEGQEKKPIAAFPSLLWQMFCSEPLLPHFACFFLSL